MDNDTMKNSPGIWVAMFALPSNVESFSKLNTLLMKKVILLSIIPLHWLYLTLLDIFHNLKTLSNQAAKCVQKRLPDEYAIYPPKYLYRLRAEKYNATLLFAFAAFTYFRKSGKWERKNSCFLRLYLTETHCTWLESYVVMSQHTYIQHNKAYQQQQQQQVQHRRHVRR